MRKLFNLIKSDLKSLDNNRIYKVEFAKDDKGKISILKRSHWNAK